MSSRRKQRVNQANGEAKAEVSAAPKSERVSTAGTLPSPLTLAQSLWRGSARWVSLALIALTAMVYAPVWQNDFVAWDDPQYVTENPMVAHGLTWQGVRWAFTTSHLANWHPVTWLSHMLDVQLFGMQAGPQHVVNLVFHVLNALLLLGLLVRWSWWDRRTTPAALGASAFVAAMFAVHPLHVESVAWISERKDVLSTLFFLLTLHAYTSYAWRPRKRAYIAALALFALGLMAKAMLVTLPFVLLLLDIWPLRRVRPRAENIGAQGPRTSVAPLLLEKVPFLAVAVLFSVIAVLVQSEGGAVAALDAFPVSLRVQNALISYVGYVGKMIWPANLAAFYPYPPSYPAWWVAGSLLILTAISVVSIWQLRSRPYLAVGWFWYLITLAPVIGLVQVGGQAMADRYTYIPLIGLFMLMAWAISEFGAGPGLKMPSLKTALSAAALCAVLACAVVARWQVSQWKNSVTLWEHTLQVTDGNFTAHTNLGHALLRQGRIDKAVAQYNEALRLRPNFADAHQGLGVALASQGKADEAIGHYREALRFQPNSAELHNYLGAALAGKNQFNEAVAEYSEALRIEPEFADARNNLGAAYASTGEYDLALREFLEALRLKPTADLEYNVGTMYEQRGDAQQAIRYYQAALKLNPGHQPARTALTELSASGQPTVH